MSVILVVDDEPSVLLAFQDLLRSGGHQVATARMAEEALDLLGRTPFDLVVMDVCLSGMDGLEALERIKAISLSRLTRNGGPREARGRYQTEA